MANLSALSKKMILVIAVLAAVICLGGLVFFRSAEAVPFALGAVAASAANVLKLMLLERMVRKIAVSEGKYPVHWVYVQYFLRFALTAGVLLLAGWLSFTALIGAAFGVFTLPLSGFAMKFFPDTM